MRTSTAELSQLVAALGSLPTAADDAERVDRIRALEQIQSAAAAAQLRETAASVTSQRESQRAAGVRADKVGRGIAAQVGLAKHISPWQAHRFVQAAMILTAELPYTLGELAAGRTSSWRALLVARETAWLSREHRRVVDRALGPRLGELGDAAVEREAKAAAYRLDPAGYVDRLRAAAKDRRVTLRPAPDTMARLSGLLPVGQGAAAYTALGRDADALIAAGDGRSRGQLMADLMVERLTGQATASAVPVEIGLIMTDRTLLHGDGEPAVLEGYGPIPAQTARDLATGSGGQPVGDGVAVWLRQLYTHPSTGELISMSSRRRFFTGALRRFITYRDQYCRTPYCGAPIRQIDHIRPKVRGGITEAANGQGQCVACNLAKEAPGWSSRPERRGGRHSVWITTPTGHSYRSRAPDPPRGRSESSALEDQFRRLLGAA